MTTGEESEKEAEGDNELVPGSHELLMHSHLFAAARGLLASGEQVIDVTLKFTFLRGEGWRAASGGGLTYLR